ncbi:MAG: LCP family protein [Oscillospiraceae bacterium]|nr:LCP family protein [Oscillospiraceae bacterium]
MKRSGNRRSGGETSRTAKRSVNSNNASPENGARHIKRSSSQGSAAFVVLAAVAVFLLIALIVIFKLSLQIKAIAITGATLGFIILVLLSRVSGKVKVISIISTVLCIVLLLATTMAIIWWKVEPFFSYFYYISDTHLAGSGIVPGIDVESPGTDEQGNPLPPVRIPGVKDDAPLPPLDEIRNTDQITFLIMGIAGGLTDTIMVASFNMEDHTLEVVNIPRDTLLNVPWENSYWMKKANYVQASMINRHGRDDSAYQAVMKDTSRYFSDMLGFELDFWITINMSAFSRLIDDIGGVTFNVPVDIDFYDEENDLHYVVPKGSRLLTGHQAMGVMRIRFVDEVNKGDLWRIQNQQNFLKAAIEQILAKKGSINISTYADIFFNRTKTNLEMESVVRLGREFLDINPSDINFYTLPGELYYRGEFVAIKVDEWLEIVNTKLSPFYATITADDVSILTYDNDSKRLYVTDGNWKGTIDWRP